MQLSPYQETILQAVRLRMNCSPKKGLIVEALAGCGKSTMLWLIVKELQEQGFQPSEVVAVVFGKKNQLDLESKFSSKVGKDWGKSVRTIHSLCYEVYRGALNVPHNRVKMESDKYRQIARSFKFLTYKRDQEEVTGTLLEGRQPAIYEEKDFLNLLDLLRLYCKQITVEEVEALTELYGLGINNFEQVTDAALRCLDQGMSDALSGSFTIDPTDMVYVPWRSREDGRFRAAIAKKRASLKVLMTDECQDTDVLQMEMLSLLVSEDCLVVAVGDRWQAVYFFRGCLNDGIERMTSRFNAETLPLPVCYRCGESHLELVRSVFPHIPIQPRPGAPRGEIRAIRESDELKIFDNPHLSYMGICRKNAPLTIAAIKLLAAGKPAKIKDKNIGSRLVGKVRDICSRKRYNPETFPSVLKGYEAAQRKRLEQFPNGEAKLKELEDILEAIWALFEHYEPATLKAWEEIVAAIFDESGYSPISLYSIHSGKGGEGQVSFILAPEEMPLDHPKQVAQEKAQEQHLIYVALTRALSDDAEGSGILYLIIREDKEGKLNWPSWLPQKYRQLWGEKPEPELEPELKPTVTVNDLQSENKQHKQPLSEAYGDWLFQSCKGTKSDKNLDKLARTETALKLKPELSDRAIADHCGVSAPFVGKIRRQLIDIGTLAADTARVDARGRTIDTANIGTRSKEKPCPIDLEEIKNRALMNLGKVSKAEYSRTKMALDAVLAEVEEKLKEIL